MKRLLLLMCVVGMTHTTSWAGAPRPAQRATHNAQRATYKAPCATPYQAYPQTYAPQPFRWGWFGAEHYQPASRTHRDFADGVWQWQYYR